MTDAPRPWQPGDYPPPLTGADRSQQIPVGRHLVADAVDLLEIAEGRLGAWTALQQHTITALREALEANPPA